MQPFRIDRLAAVLLFTAMSPAAVAQDYWSYSYKGFDAITTAGSGHAVSLAHDLARFDTALTRILKLPEKRLPTHIYELSGKEVKELLGEADAATYKFSGYEVSVITGTGAHGSDRWGALFGYTGSLLVSGRASRTPYWYRMGVPQLFAHTEFGPGSVTTGGVVPGFAQTLLHTKLIPMRVFLAMQPNDPQLRTSSDFYKLFEAESWYLAREIYVENKLRSEFGNYLALTREGKSESDAFAASFKISYEDLDRLLVQAMREPAHKYVVNVPREPADDQQPRKLSVIEAKTLLADLSLLVQHRADALRLATEALQADSNSELSLRILARANLQDGDFAASLAAVDKLAALTAPSAAALTDSGDVLFGVARAVSAKQASIGTNSDTLSGRAKGAYERAIQLEPDDLRAWAGLAYLYGSLRDNVAARALVTRAQPVMEKRLDSGALARALASMCYQTEQTEAAFLFGQYWRDDAITPRDLDEARAFMARLHAR
jgi:tetratricopeptide (TPR) repeat protein